MFTHAALFTLHFIGGTQRVASTKASYQSFEFHQVRDPHESTPSTNHGFRIRGGEVGPLPGNGAHSRIVNLQQQPLAIPVVPLADANELLPSERMKRMRYAHKVHYTGRRVFILN